MDKEKRKQGEKYIVCWAEGRKSIEKIQKDINTIKKSIQDGDNLNIDGINIYDVNYSESKETIDTYIDILEEKELELKNKIRSCKIVDDVINRLEEYQKDVIKFRYIEKNSWEAVSLKSHISVRHCFNIKNFVIENILDTI